MSWVDKAHKRNKMEKQIEEVLNSPEYKEQQREFQANCVANALGRFLFFACGYLETRHNYKKAGLQKFLHHVRLALKATEDDENFFIDYEKYFLEEMDLDVLAELGLRLEGKNVK